MREDVRYQLLHRTAAAVIEARRFGVEYALMLVHSFSQSDEWLADYAAFVELFGAKGECGTVVQLRELSGVTLHAGWVRGSEEWV